MKPIKVLIVDDEVPVRQEMSAYPWKDYGCTWVGEAKNGKEALQLCSEQLPDIVISDISMPVMNGLELAQELRILYPNIQVIILTGHENFDYVKAALRLNVVDYIVKFEMNATSIAAIIKKARQKLIENGILKQSVTKDMRRKIAKYLVWMQNDKELEVEVRREVEDILYSLKVLKKDKQNCTFLYVDIPVEHGVAAHDELSEYVEGHKYVEGWSLLFSGIYGIRLYDQYAADYQSCLDTLCDDIIQYLESLVEISQLFTVTYHDVRGLDHFIHYMKAVTVWKGTYFYKAPERIYDSGQLVNMKAFEKSMQVELNQVFSLIETDRDMFKRNFIEYAAHNRIDAEGLKLFAARWLKGHLNKAGRTYSDYLDLDIQEINTVGDMADYILQACMSETKYRVEIKKAIEIINDEYQRRLPLSEVAYRIGLSSQYFSRLFREETGKTYSDYLISVRIRRAQELLKEGHFKVYEIAELVGIPNYRYFSALFKKITGFAPKQTGKGNGYA